MIDKATTFKQWLYGLITLKDHVTIGALIVIGVGIHVLMIGSMVSGVLLIITGTGIAVDQAAHLNTN